MINDEQNSQLTMSLSRSYRSFTMNIMSNLDKIVGMKSMFCSPLVSSHLPYTELAAANTEQREFRVVVIPACGNIEQDAMST